MSSTVELGQNRPLLDHRFFSSGAQTPEIGTQWPKLLVREAEHVLTLPTRPMTSFHSSWLSSPTPTSSSTSSILTPGPCEVEEADVFVTGVSIPKPLRAISPSCFAAVDLIC